MATQFTVQQNDITTLPSDLLLLKYANGFHGGDLAVAMLLTNAGVCTEAEISPRPDDYVAIDTRQAVAPARVMFLGTPALRDFSYGQMHHFATRAIEILAEEGLQVRRVTTTIHGVNYGLDASESLQSLVRGFQEGLARHPECRIEEISFVEKRERTARILKAALESLELSVPSAPGRLGHPASEEKELSSQIAPAPRVRPRTADTGEYVRRTAEPAKKHVLSRCPSRRISRTSTSLGSMNRSGAAATFANAWMNLHLRVIFCSGSRIGFRPPSS